MVRLAPGQFSLVTQLPQCQADIRPSCTNCSACHSLMVRSSTYHGRQHVPQQQARAEAVITGEMAASFPVDISSVSGASAMAPAGTHRLPGGAAAGLERLCDDGLQRRASSLV